MAERSAGLIAMRWFYPAALVIPAGIEYARYRLVTEGVLDRLPSAFAAALSISLIGLVVIALGARRLDRYERDLIAARDTSLLSVVAHELRAPLVAMRNLADVVDTGWEELSDEQKRRALRTTVEEAARMLDLVHDASQLSRLDAGALSTRPKAVTLCEAVLDAISGQGREVVVRCPPAITVVVDPEHLRLMLAACMSDVAADAEGPIVVAARVRGADVALSLEVPHPRPGDDGTVDAPRAGLWTVAELARLSRGEARFERIDDERSRFVLTFPLAVRGQT